MTERKFRRSSICAIDLTRPLSHLLQSQAYCHRVCGAPVRLVWRFALCRDRYITVGRARSLLHGQQVATGDTLESPELREDREVLAREVYLRDDTSQLHGLRAYGARLRHRFRNYRGRLQPCRLSRRSSAFLRHKVSPAKQAIQFVQRRLVPSEPQRERTEPPKIANQWERAQRRRGQTESVSDQRSEDGDEQQRRPLSAARHEAREPK